MMKGPHTNSDVYTTHLVNSGEGLSATLGSGYGPRPPGRCLPPGTGGVAEKADRETTKGIQPGKLS